jgi:hypothetical protein
LRRRRSYSFFYRIKVGSPTRLKPSYGQEEKQKSSKFGMGTGLAAGAVGGLLGGLAIAEGVDYVEDKIDR